ncbi:MAG TPA: DoxX family membrane protein [Nocardioides sp.]|uniref:DoxX family membrane protein n=1 Tax=Nocardioides sp. TaxID=35761 RepID=UPI002ED7A680
MTVSRLVARPLLSSIYLIGPVNALRDPSWAAGEATRVTDKVQPLVRSLGQRLGVPVPEKPETWVRLNAGLQIVAALGLATGRAPRTCAAVLAATTVPTTLAGHAFWDEEQPQNRRAQQLQFAKNASLLGGLIIAAGDTDGRPGLAWRAGRAAKDARRAARLARREARREAKLIAAKVHLP